ncbi:MAG: MgtC/SapB family protein [Segetibacter sp.]|nr:MgtC/SapB family protein [Segetibacter sp.]
MEIPWNDIIKILVAFVAGTLLGIEREYRDKPAGLRTIILITVGAALFSLLNLTIDTESPDRIASNVVTGVGFVGAGVIFKEGMNVKGLTSAATIWVAAAIGMAIGFGNYWLGCTTLFLTLIVLTLLSKFEQFLDAKLVAKEFKFCFDKDVYSVNKLEDELSSFKISYIRFRLSKNENELTAEYRLKLSKEQYKSIFEFLVNNKEIKNFQEM